MLLYHNKKSMYFLPKYPQNKYVIFTNFNFKVDISVLTMYNIIRKVRHGTKAQSAIWKSSTSQAVIFYCPSPKTIKKEVKYEKTTPTRRKR